VRILQTSPYAQKRNYGLSKEPMLA
jgi:hypothetical protein